MSLKLETMLRKALSNVKHISEELRAGPEKTVERCIAKITEYEGERDTMNTEFLERFDKLARKNNIVYFVESYRILDYARVSVLFPTVGNLMSGVAAVKECFDVRGLKNGFIGDAPPSGYRDLKLLVSVKSDESITIGDITIPEGTPIVCEIQFVLEKWMVCKKTTSTSYKIRRAACWQRLCRDFHKYFESKYDL